MSELDAEVCVWLDQEVLNWAAERAVCGDAELRESKESMWEGEGSTVLIGGRRLKADLGGELLSTRMGGKAMSFAVGLSCSWAVSASFAAGSRVEDLCLACLITIDSPDSRGEWFVLRET